MQGRWGSEAVVMMYSSTPPLLTGLSHAPASTEGLFSSNKDGLDVARIDQGCDASLVQFRTLFKLGKQATATEFVLPAVAADQQYVVALAVDDVGAPCLVFLRSSLQLTTLKWRRLIPRSLRSSSS